MATSSEEPPVIFSTFLVSLASSALAHLGQVDHPSNQPTSQDVALARHTVGLIDMLALKTKGNLDTDEQRLLETLQKELKDKLAAAPSR